MFCKCYKLVACFIVYAYVHNFTVSGDRYNVVPGGVKCVIKVHGVGSLFKLGT
ncbi:hypothetical protein VPH5P1C_0131 [Vibrio phage 5P1c]